MMLLPSLAYPGVPTGAAYASATDRQAMTSRQCNRLPADLSPSTSNCGGVVYAVFMLPPLSPQPCQVGQVQPGGQHCHKVRTGLFAENLKSSASDAMDGLV